MLNYHIKHGFSMTYFNISIDLTLSWWRPLSYRNLMGQLQEKCWKDWKMALPATVKNIYILCHDFQFSIFWTKIAIKVKNSSLLLHQSKNLYYLKKSILPYNSKKWPSKLLFCRSLCKKLNFESHFLLLSRMANLSIIRYLLIWKILDNYYFNSLKKKIGISIPLII